MSDAQEELKSAQSKFTVTVSEYSSKLLSSEKKYTVLRDQFNEQAEVVKSRDQVRLCFVSIDGVVATI